MGKRLSIQVKYSLVFIITLALMAGAFTTGLIMLREQVLRNEAKAVAEQVIAFRAWVAGTGMVWVNKLSPEFPDYLASRDNFHGDTFYGKNPALATRELSVVANKISQRATFLVTSDDYRQPANKPDDFELEAIAAFKNNSDLELFDTFQKDKYRYAKPIVVKQSCLKCHGNPEDAPPEVIEKYGSERSFGYKVGDIRGIISVKLPSIGWQELLPVVSNPIVIGLVILAFVLNFLFTQLVIIKRLIRLTNDATAIAKGKLSTSLQYTNPTGSKDEIDHAYHAINLLKKSLNIILKRSKQK